LGANSNSRHLGGQIIIRALRHRRAPTRCTGRRRWPRWLLAALLLDALAVAAYVIAGALSLPPPIPSQPHAAGVVFFDGFGTGTDGLSAGSRERLGHALDLYRGGHVRLLVCVGGAREGRSETGSGLMADALLAQGLPAAAVRHDTVSFDSISNWRAAQALLPPDAAADPLLISDALHLLRIRRITGGVGTPAPSTSLPDAFRGDPLRFWVDVHREWLATAAATLLPADLYRDWVKALRDFIDALRRSAPAAQS
jgi:uncharacterized SAM-binding protein YcdF (DUF218 family)